jgi:hypothetical protein
MLATTARALQDHLPAQNVSEWARSFVHNAWNLDKAA